MSASATTGASTSAATSGASSAATAPGTATSPSGTTMGGPACPEFDPGPVDDPDSGFSWECLCQTCELSFPDIPLETVNQFDQGGLCDCLCAEAGCGFVQGEGGVGGGPAGETGSDTATTTAGTATTTGEPDTDSVGETTEGGVALTVGACLDEGGEVIGDPGDGSVFEPDYVCPSGESPLGILDFEPGMPFPKNGGVCCL